MTRSMRNRSGRGRSCRPSFELLESRYLLSGDAGVIAHYASVSPELAVGIRGMPGPSGARVDSPEFGWRYSPAPVAGPRPSELFSIEWGAPLRARPAFFDEPFGGAPWQQVSALQAGAESMP